MFSCEVCKIFKNTFSYRTPSVAASVCVCVCVISYQFFVFNPIMSGVTVKFKHTLKILHHLSQDIYRVFDHFVDTTHYRVNIISQIEKRVIFIIKVLCREGIPKNFVKFTGKHFQWHLFLESGAVLTDVATVALRFTNIIDLFKCKQVIKAGMLRHVVF